MFENKFDMYIRNSYFSEYVDNHFFDSIIVTFSIFFVLIDALSFYIISNFVDWFQDLARWKIAPGSDHGLDTFTTKRHFSVQEAAFSNPDAYIRIYETLSY